MIMKKYYCKPRVWTPAAAIGFLAAAIRLEIDFGGDTQRVRDGLDQLCDWLDNVYHVSIMSSRLYSMGPVLSAMIDGGLR